MKFKHFLSLLIIGSVLACSSQKEEVKQIANPSIDYETAWLKIESLEQKGMQKTAILELDNVITAALEDEKLESLFKAVAIRSKYLSQLDENSSEKIIQSFHDQIDKSQSPAKQLLESALAEIYFQYLESNRWGIMERTKESRSTSKSISFMSIDEIEEVGVQLYLSSLENAEITMKARLSDYDEILLFRDKDSSYTQHFRLYDLLAKRALDYFEYSSPNLYPSKELAEYKRLFSNLEEFLSTSWSIDEDATNSERWLQIISKTLEYHKADSKEEALLYFNLRRLKGSLQISDLETKFSLYKKQLQNIIKNLRTADLRDEVRFELASSLQQTDSLERSIEICNACEDPASYGAKKCSELQRIIESKAHQLNLETVYTSNQAILFSYEYKNMHVAFWRIIELNGEEVWNETYQDRDWMKRMLKRTPIRSWQTDLQHWGDYKNHRAELFTDGLKSGHYLLMASDREDFLQDSAIIAVANLSCSNIAYLQRQLTDGGAELRIVNRESGEPLIGAEVTLYQSSYNNLNNKNEWKKSKSLIATNKGRITLKAEERYANYRFEIKHLNQELISRSQIYLNSIPRTKEARYFTQFFTDRSIYRPGQRVLFKGIISSSLANKTQTIQGKSTTVKLYNPKGEELNSIDLKSNQFGSFAAEFALPEDGLNGNYRLANQFGNYYFRVEDYRRPSIRIVLDSSISAYKLGDTICTKGFIESYTGLPVNQAQLEYKVVRKEIQSPRSYLNSYFPPSTEVILEHGKMELSDNHFEICFETHLSSPRNSSYHYELQINVVSPLGENIEKTKIYSIGKAPFQLTSYISENINTNDLNQLLLKAISNQGKEVFVKGQLELWSLEVPEKYHIEKYWPESDHFLIDKAKYNELFPQYSKSNKTTLAAYGKKAIISRTAFETDKAINAFRTLEEGAYLIHAYSIIENGDTAHWSQRVRINNRDSKKPPFSEFFWFQIEHEVITEGDYIKIQLNSSAESMKILLELEHDQKIVQSKSVELSNEKKWIQFPTKGLEGLATIHISGVNQNRAINHSIPITIQVKKPKFSLFLKTKRDVSRPKSKEKWSIGIENLEKGDNVEVMASLYDHSLDELEKQEWRIQELQERGSRLAWNSKANFDLTYARIFQEVDSYRSTTEKSEFPRLNWFDFRIGYGSGIRPVMYKNIALSEAYMASSDMMTVDGRKSKSENLEKRSQIIEEKKEIRNDFRETVFFYPQLQNPGSNEIGFGFEMPDALTEWRFRALGHDQEMNFHQIDHLLVSKKELMVKAYFPRFFRCNDNGFVKLEVTNASDSAISGTYGMKIFDAESGKLIDLLEEDGDRTFNIMEGESINTTYAFRSPAKPCLLRYQIYGKGERHQDVEEGFIEVLPSTILITKSFPIEANPGESKKLEYKEFKKDFANVAQNRLYKVEYSADPRWLAVYALPSMLKSEYQCPEMVFSTLYANTLAAYTANQINDLEDYVLGIGKGKDLSSQLEMKQDVKMQRLEGTPWISVAREESLQRKSLAQLFDANQQAYEINQKLKLLEKLRLPDGGWPWFKGMKSNRYISQYILSGLAKLNKLNVIQSEEDQNRLKQMLREGYASIDRLMMEDFQRLKQTDLKDNQDYIGASAIQYLYCRSFDKAWKPNAAAAFYLQEARQHWQNKNALLKSLIALSNYQTNPQDDLPIQIIASLKDNAIRDSLGMHWKFASAGPYWHQSPIEAQAYLIELFQTTMPEDQDLSEMKKWLLHQKKQQYWPGNKASSEACYALLHSEKQLSYQMEEGSIRVGGEDLSSGGSAMPAYTSKSWKDESIREELGEVEIQQNKSSFGWGSAYWQYYEEMNKVDDHSKEGLKIRSTYYRYTIDKAGKDVLSPINTEELGVGELVRQRMEIEIDYSLDFVNIVDSPPACLETTESKSGMQYIEGIAFYANVKDSEREWFIDHLPQGRYVFETDYRVSHSGNYIGGVSRLQCMYAPEFVAHTSAGSLKIK